MLQNLNIVILRDIYFAQDVVSTVSMSHPEVYIVFILEETVKNLLAVIFFV